MAQAQVAHRPARSGAKPEEKAEAKGGIQGKLAGIKAKLEAHTLGRIILSVAEGYQRDRLGNQAAAMTYFGIFSLFPLLLLFMALAGLALQSNDAAREQVLNVVIGLLPQGQDKL